MVFILRISVLYFIKKINTEYKKVQEKLLQVEKLIKTQNPEYFEFLKIRTADIKDLQQFLNEDQAILDYFFSKSNFIRIE